MEQFDRYIWKVDPTETSDDPNVTGPGWYYQDETEQLIGPYSSRQEALDALDAYSRWLNAD